jgi:hypothetical protein
MLLAAFHASRSPSIVKHHFNGVASRLSGLKSFQPAGIEGFGGKNFKNETQSD